MLAVASGISTPEAFQKIYGKSVPDVAKDAAKYVRQASVQAALYNITLPKTDLEPEVAELSDFQIDLALTDLLGARPETAPEARQRLLALEQKYPNNANVEESLGYLAWQQNNVAEARKHFARAVESGSKNARTIYDYAGLEYSSGAPVTEVMDLMQRVIAIEPDNADAEIQLANLETSQREYSAALAAISQLHTIKPEQAYNFFSIAAFCKANLHDPDGARNSAKRALQYAKTASERQQIDNLLSFLDQSNRSQALTAIMSSADKGLAEEAQPSENASRFEQRSPISLERDANLPRVKGKTKAFECGQGVFQLRIQAGDREMVFAMNDLQNIVVRNVKELTWTCGVLPPRELTVVYQPASGAKLDGTVVELIF
jgi:tetratricopeptide (TPR) repeat protein